MGVATIYVPGFVPLGRIVEIVVGVASKPDPVYAVNEVTDCGSGVGKATVYVPGFEPEGKTIEMVVGAVRMPVPVYAVNEAI